IGHHSSMTSEAEMEEVTKEAISRFDINCFLLAFDTPPELVSRIDAEKFSNLTYAMIQVVAITMGRSAQDVVYLRYSPDGNRIKGTAIMPADVTIEEGGLFGWRTTRLFAASLGSEITIVKNEEACTAYWTLPVVS